MYETRVLEELAQLLAAVPHDQLAIQWDARNEFAMLEGQAPAWFDGGARGVLERLLRLSRQSRDVELGFHLCYGDEAHGHFAPEVDVRKLVEVANGLAVSLSRPLNWIHMPLPRSISEESLRPAGGIDAAARDRAVLGHRAPRRWRGGCPRTDRRRPPPRASFGVATDCGWGRGGSEKVQELLELHRAVSIRCPRGYVAGTQATLRGPRASSASQTTNGLASRSMKQRSPTTTSKSTAGTAT